VLSIAHSDAGPAAGPPVLLLRGSIYSFVDAAPMAQRSGPSLCRLQRRMSIAASVWVAETMAILENLWH